MTPARPTVDVEGLRRSIAAYVCNVSNLPEPMQVPAMGLNMGGLIDGLNAAMAPYLIAATERAEAAEDALAAVTAERDEARAAVERVQMLLPHFDTRAYFHPGECWGDAAQDLRTMLSPTAALDHVPATEGGEE